MLSTGIFLALLTTLSWSIGIFPFTQAARRLGVNVLNHFRLLLAMIVIGIVAAIVGWSSFTGIFSENYFPAWMWLGLSGIVGLTIGDYFAFVMYKILGARTGSVLTTFAPAAALILGSIMIDEHISMTGITGMLITIAGVNFISFGKKERSKMTDLGHGSLAYGIVAGILGAFCQGAGLVLAKKGMISQPSEFHLDPLHATFMRLAAAFFSLLAFTLVRGNLIEIILPVIRNQNGGLKYAISGTMFGPVTGVCLSLYTVSIIEPSIAQTIFSLVPAFAFLLSAFFFKEKITGNSVLGLVTAIAGVVILIWRNHVEQIIANIFA